MLQAPLYELRKGPLRIPSLVPGVYGAYIQADLDSPSILIT